MNAVSNAWIDGGALRTYRHAPNTGSRKSWAAGDATSRGVRHRADRAARRDGLSLARSARRSGASTTCCSAATRSSTSKASAATSWRTCCSRSASRRSSMRRPPSNARCACTRRCKDRLDADRAHRDRDAGAGRAHHRQDRPARESRRPRPLPPVHGRRPADPRPPDGRGLRGRGRRRSAHRRAAIAHGGAREPAVHRRTITTRTSASSATRSRCSSRTARRPSEFRSTPRSAIGAGAPRATRCWSRNSGLRWRPSSRRNSAAASRRYSPIRPGWTRLRWTTSSRTSCGTDPTPRPQSPKKVSCPAALARLRRRDLPPPPFLPRPGRGPARPAM